MPPAREPGLDDSSAGSSGRAGRSMFGILLGHTLARVTGWVAPLGRYSLYTGLVLVALPSIRLLGRTGTSADAFLLVSMVCAIRLLWQGRTLKVGLLRTHAIGLGLVVGGVVIGTLAQSSDGWQSLLQLSKFLFATTATIVTCMVLLERRDQLRTALGCWVVSAAVTSAGAMIQASFGDSLISDGSILGRMTGLSGNPNHLGAVAGMAIGGALCLAALSQRLARIFWLTAAVLCIFGVIASASRAGAVIALASLGLWAVMSHRTNRPFTILVLGCCLTGAAVASFIFVQVWSGVDIGNRFVSAADPYADVAVASRLYQYQDIFRDALRSPLLGVGLAADDVDFQGRLVHNTLLMLLRAGGLLAVVGIIVILADLFLKGLIAYRQTGSRRTRGLVVGLLAGTVGIILDGLVEPVLFQREYWLPSALLFACLSIAQGHPARNATHSRYLGPPDRPRRSRHRRSQTMMSQLRKNVP